MSFELIRPRESAFPPIFLASGTFVLSREFGYQAQIFHRLVVFGALLVLREATWVIQIDVANVTCMSPDIVVFGIDMSAELNIVAALVFAQLTLLYFGHFPCRASSLSSGL